MKNTIAKLIIVAALLISAFMIVDNPRDASSYLGLLSNGLIILSMIIIIKGLEKKDKSTSK